MISTKTLIAFSAALWLVACGSGSSHEQPVAAPPADPPVAGTEVPTSATANSEAATRFVIAAAAESSESREPIEMGNAQLAASDTAEPQE